MELTGSRTVPASVAATWAALNDPEVLRACIPGCASLERTAENEFRAAMTTRIGPVSARFSGRVRLNDIVPPRSYTLSFEGQGGAAGFANGEARVALDAQDGGTRIDYTVKAKVGGKLAQVGSRLIDGAAVKLANDFFTHLVERLQAQQVEAPDANVTENTAVAGVVRRWPSQSIRLAIAVVIIVAMAIYWLTHAA